MKNSKIVLMCLTLVSSMLLLMGCEASSAVTTTVATTEKIVETKVAEVEVEEKETVKETTKKVEKKAATNINVTPKFKAIPAEQTRVDSKDYLGVDGDMLIQSVTANANGGVQWNFVSLKGKTILEDEVSNFYDIESTTEVGDVSYFLRAIRKGEDVLMFTLHDTKSGEIYCVVKYYITINSKLSDSGYNIINLNKREIFDYRPNAMAAYGFGEPEVMYHARGNGN